MHKQTDRLILCYESGTRLDSLYSDLLGVAEHLIETKTDDDWSWYSLVTTLLDLQMEIGRASICNPQMSPGCELTLNTTRGIIDHNVLHRTTDSLMSSIKEIDRKLNKHWLDDFERRMKRLDEEPQFTPSRGIEP